MKTRKLGNQGLETSAIGLGCMGMSIAYGEMDEEGSIATINKALDIGVNLINSSDAYANGKNEELIGKAIKGRRDDVIITTKFGQIRAADGSQRIDGTPEYVVEACEASLKRLGVDHIDLYHQHRVDTETPIEETMGAMSRLVEQGKVRYLGLSEAGADTIRRAHATHPMTAVETEYSLWTRDVEAEILPTCRELGIGFVAYAPLGRGFLTGKFRKPGDLLESDQRHNHPRFKEENMEQNVWLVEALDKAAETLGVKVPQVALAWLLAQGDDIVPISGTQHPAYIAENAGATDVELSTEVLDQLAEVFVVDVTAGTRYPEGMMKRLGL